MLGVNRISMSLESIRITELEIFEFPTKQATMEAVVKSLRRREGDATSETYSLQALEMFVSIYPSPKTLTVHARFLERLVPCVDTREPISAPVPISKSPSLCLQGFQLALKNEDLPSL
ncbi:hypothetical protein DYB25_008088, partial [Aphanomyces astaci]